eukprot:m.186404 g.186404  ORF g.186404 m.186404 type:complete len:438 (-) comp32267_c0_seq1:216-1529(-)
MATKHRDHELSNAAQATLPHFDHHSHEPHGWNFVTEHTNGRAQVSANDISRQASASPTPRSVVDVHHHNNIATSKATLELQSQSQSYVNVVNAKADSILRNTSSSPSPSLPSAQIPLRDYSCFQTAITESVCASFTQNGFVVVDSVFGDDWAGAFRSEMGWLARNNLLQPNETQFASRNIDGTLLPQRFVKPHIYELDLHVESMRKLVPEFNSLFERLVSRTSELVTALHKHMPELKLNPHTNGMTIKLQYNDGKGGCFPIHYDNPGRPNNRVVTCLVYLNSDWQQGDGGELRLFPFCEREVAVVPLFDRMVLFRADRVLHGVAPANKQRFCFTIWIDGVDDSVNNDNDVLLKTKHVVTTKAIEDVVFDFRHSGLQRVLSRGVYKEIYEASLRDCQGRGAQCMIESHQLMVTAMAESPMLSSLIERLRQHHQQKRTT